jgi:hypothetical protein
MTIRKQSKNDFKPFIMRLNLSLMHMEAQGNLSESMPCNQYKRYQKVFKKHWQHWV